MKIYFRVLNRNIFTRKCSFRQVFKFNGYEIYSFTGIGSTALHASASYTSAIDATVWLLQNFPHLIYEKNAHGGTPLHAAACRNNLQGVVELLKFGANVATGDAKGRKPIDLANLNEYVSVSDVLREAESVVADMC